MEAVVAASEIYGRITGMNDQGQALDKELRRLSRAQGAPSYMLLLWLMSKAKKRGIAEAEILEITRWLTNFFVRRNLTGFPQTYAMPRIFMEIIERLAAEPETDVGGLVGASLADQSVGDDAFKERLLGPVYEDSADVTRFILVTLAEDAMTKENSQNLWDREGNHYVWTIEHVLPQGSNLPPAWQDMLGGKDAAGAVQEKHVHRLGNLTITGYNSSLGNKSFEEKKSRTDSKGNPIGYKNGLKLNEDIVCEETWTGGNIEKRTQKLGDLVLKRFPLPAKTGP